MESQERDVDSQASGWEFVRRQHRRRQDMTGTKLCPPFY